MQERRSGWGWRGYGRLLARIVGWRVTTWARIRGRLDKRWRLEAHPDELVLILEQGRVVLAGEDLRRLTVHRGWFSASLFVEGIAPPRMKGLRKRDVRDVEAAAARALARHRALPAVRAAVQWHQQVLATAHQAEAGGR